MLQRKDFSGNSFDWGCWGFKCSRYIYYDEQRGRKVGGKGSKTSISGVREATKYGGGYVTVCEDKSGLAHKGLSTLLSSGKKIFRGQLPTSLSRWERRNIYRRHNHKKCGEPSHYLMSDWNKGFYYAMEGFNCARPLVATASWRCRENLRIWNWVYKERRVLVRLWQNLRDAVSSGRGLRTTWIR